MNKTLKKALSVILCVLMAFSTVTLAFASDGETKPSLGAQYFLSTSNNENASVALDYIDGVLAKANLNAEIDKNIDKDVEVLAIKLNIKKTIERIGLTIDLNSVNGVLKTLDSLKKNVLDVKKSTLFIPLRIPAKALLGDIYNFSLGNWKSGLSRGSKDGEIIYNFIEALGANAVILSKVMDKSFDLGAFKYVFNLDDIIGKDGVSGIIKDLLVSLVYDKNSDSEGYNAAYQKALSDFDAFIFDDLLPKLLKEYLPGLKLSKGITVDQLFSAVLESGWKNYFIEDIKSINIEARGEALQKLSEIMEFNGQNIDTDNLPLDSSKGLKDQLNNIHGYIICAFFPKFDGWTKGSDIKLLGQNYAKLLRYLSNHFFGNENAKPIDILKYIMNSVAEANSGDAEINEYAAAISSCKDLSEALRVVLILAAKKNNIPVNEKAASYENVLGDYLAYAANMIFDLGYGPGSGKSVWTVANDVLNLCLFEKGFAKALNLGVSKNDSCFAKLDKIIGTTKLWNMTGSKTQYKSEEFFKGVLNAILNFDMEKAFDLIVVRFSKDFGSSNISVLLYNIVYNFLENWFGTPAIVKCDTKAPFQTGFSNASLKVPVEKVLTKLNEKKTTIVPPFLYTAAVVVENFLGEPTTVNITDASAANGVYIGKEVFPSSVTVTVNGKKVKIPAYQFTAELENNVQIGTAYGVLHLNGAIKDADVNISFKIVPAKVTGLKSKAGNKSVTLSWNSVLGAESYVAEYYNGSQWIAKEVSGTTASFTGLKAGTAYKFRVKASANGESGEYASITASSRLAKVTNVRTKARTANSITLTWNKVAGAKKYEVQMLKNGKWVTVRTVSENKALIGKRYISANKTYTFRIRALGATADLNGEYSAETKAFSGLSRITKVNATKVKKNALTLTWKKVAGAKTYEVQVQKGKKWVTVSSVRKPTAVIKNKQLQKAKLTFKANTVYKFRVRAAKTVSGQNVYSVYSPIAKVRTAK